MFEPEKNKCLSNRNSVVNPRTLIRSLSRKSYTTRTWAFEEIQRLLWRTKDFPVKHRYNTIVAVVRQILPHNGTVAIVERDRSTIAKASRTSWFLGSISCE